MAYQRPPGFGPPQQSGGPPAGVGFAVPPQTEPPPGFAQSGPPGPPYGSFGPRQNVPNPGPPPFGLHMPGTAGAGPQPDHSSAPTGQYQPPSAGLSGWQLPKDSHKEGRPPSQERGAPRPPTAQGPGWEKPDGAVYGSRSSEKTKPSGGGMPPTARDKGANRSSSYGPSAPGIVPQRQAEQSSSGPIYGLRDPTPPQGGGQPSGPFLGMMGAPPLIGFIPPEAGTGLNGYPPDSWSNSSRQGPPGPSSTDASRSTARKSSEGHGSTTGGAKQKSREGSRSRSRRSRTAAEEQELLEAIKQFEALLDAEIK
ncbi:uncharacterized protein LOC144118624 [Amblyomma americanum]